MEILAPAGTADMLSAAVLAGADAVYLGMQGFNARRTAGNFTPEALRDAVSFCHARGAKVYVTMNTIVYPGELSALTQVLADIAAAGADAVIVQDLAVAALVKQCVPQLALHASTQMSIHSLAGAKTLARLGFSRVILSRELSLEEIAHITRHCGIETEVFVHGALCMCVSGQCYMSAFLGGRSGNRGACAGPCRLPFDARVGVDTAQGHHLSLKDMSYLPMLEQLQQAGVASVKIEGRLRTPEYAAAAVNACRQKLCGGLYDGQLLQDVFSRSGFTDGYINGRLDGTMFGVRTEADTAAAKAALPKLRELYRRELARVPVDVCLTLEEDGAKLAVTDDAGNRAVVYSEVPTQAAEKDLTESYARALGKTGGTPFFLRTAQVAYMPQDKPRYLQAAEVNEMRRAALAQLLERRSNARALPFTPPEFPFALPQVREDAAADLPRKKIYAQFETVAQMPSGAAACDGLIVPLAQWQDVPAALQSKTWLALPRYLTPKAEELCAGLIAQTKQLGFAGYFVQNLAHVGLCEGLPMLGGFGLNITNELAARAYDQLGVAQTVFSCEMTVSDMSYASISTQKQAALAYGHMPLMLTRACPLHNVRTCAGCDGKGELLDRKGMHFPVRCSGPAAAGVRTVYNPVPIYMGDKQNELPAEILLLAFTIETQAQAGAVLSQFLSRRSFDGAFTRGLYFKGTTD